ncbi:2-hydroxyisoflavanone dehydratase-like [Diospyros lotus]|uniref:2-hydroxyisoflavanone dehydratase-like n=1 Tax=Diospyros lotus TaxID=55363 RepID=UPI00225BC793|nr:2-hydroxyisoflavanone dehydratase-like [Diospyros lotus]
MAPKHAAPFLLLFVFFAPALSARHYPDTLLVPGHHKDVKFGNGVPARLYLPTSPPPNKKLPLVVFFHGGAFITFSAFLPPYDDYVQSIANAGNVVALSVEYTLALERPLPAAYEDSWAALEWVASHSSGNGPEPWLNQLVDFEKVYIAGDSAGGNIAHNLAMKHGLGSSLEGLEIDGMALICPFFWGSQAIGKQEPRGVISRAPFNLDWLTAVGFHSGLDDYRINPLIDPNLPKLGVKKALVITANQDPLRDRGFYYYQALRSDGWKGDAQYLEYNGWHDFQLVTPFSEDSQNMLQQLSKFFNSE